MQNERRSTPRRKFEYYMPVLDNQEHEILGYLSDISLNGFRLESRKTVTIDTVYSLRLDITPDISSQEYILFSAKAIWSEPDSLTPNEYNHGFQIVEMGPEEQQIFQRIIKKFGVS